MIELPADALWLTGLTARLELERLFRIVEELAILGGNPLAGRPQGLINVAPDQRETILWPKRLSLPW